MTSASWKLAGVRRLQIGLRRTRWLLCDVATALDLCVDLGAEQQRERAQPQPRERYDHGPERAPRLVVRTECGGIESERTRHRDPRERGDERSGSDESPTAYRDVRPEVEQRLEGDEQAGEEDGPLRDPPNPA